MLNQNVVNNANSAAAISAATVTSNGLSVTYTTVDEHNFITGQSVTITGLTGNTAANLSGALIANTPSSTKFVAYVPGTAIATSAVTAAAGSTAWVTNSWASSVRLKYGSPEPVKTVPSFVDVNANIFAAAHYPYPTNGTVSVDLTWTALGSANPPLVFNIVQYSGTTPTTVTGGSAVSPSSSTPITITGLNANTSYVFGIIGTNSGGSVVSSTTISVDGYASPITNLNAAPTASTANSITVTWTAPTTASPAIATYQVQRAQSSDNATFSAWTTATTTASTSFTDTSSISGAYYYKYQVQGTATDGTTVTGYTTSASVQPYFITTPMNIPSVSYVSTSSVNLNVSTTATSNPAISSWTIQRGTVSGTYTFTATTPTLPYVDSGVSQNTQYFYTISGNNGQVTSATSAASVGTTTYSAPNAPTALSATAVAYNTINLAWTAATVNNSANTVTGYIVQRATNSGFTTGLTTLSSTVTGTSYSDSTANELTTYYYRVYATNGLGNSAASSSANATTPAQAINTNITATNAATIYYGSSFTISGSVSPIPTGGTVTVTESGSTVATAAVNPSTGAYTATISTQAVGTHNFTVSYGGNNPYQPSSTTTSYQVLKIVTSIPTPTVTNSTYPTAVTVSGTVTPNPGGGTVYLIRGGTVVGSTSVVATSGAYSISSTDTNAGTYTGILVNFDGTGTNYANSNSASFNYTVSQNQPTATAAITSVFNAGSATTVSGNLKKANGTALASTTVYFDYSTASNFSSYTNIGSDTTDASGNASISWTGPGGGTYYVRLRYGGSTNYKAASDSASTYLRSLQTASYNHGGTANTWVWYGSTSTASQVGSTFTMPSGSGTYYDASTLKVTSIDVSIAGYSGKDARVIGCLWDSATSPDSLISSGSTVYASSQSGGGAFNHNLPLTDVGVTAGHVYVAGFWRYHTSTSYYTQWDLDTSSGNTTYYDNSASSPASLTHDTTKSSNSLLFTVNYSYYA